MTDTYTPTLGPADPKAPLVQKVYAVVAAILTLAGVAGTLGVITNDQSASIAGLGTAVTTLIGAVITALAAFRTKKQLNNGTFTQAPQLPVVPALEQMKIIRDQAATEVDRVTQAGVAGAAAIKTSAQTALDALGSLPVPGAAQVADAADDLLAQFRI